MRNEISLALSSIILTLSVASTVAAEKSNKPSVFIVKKSQINQSVVTSAAKLKDYIPAYSIRVNNNSAYLVYATAYDGYGGQMTFEIDPHYAATIQNNYNPPMGYDIHVTTAYGGVIFEGYVRSLACVDIYATNAMNYRVTNYCLQPY
jgi:hypothetical protein